MLKPITPKSQITSALRMLWLRSRERGFALKRDQYSCQECGAKGKGVKLHVHHLNGIRWDYIIEYIYRHLLVDPKELETLCKKCHTEITKDKKKNDTTYC